MITHTGYTTKGGLQKCSPFFFITLRSLGEGGFQLLLLLIVLSNPFTASAKIEDNDRCRKALNEVLNLNFSAAKFLLAEEQKSNPDNNFRLFVENYIDFIELTISEDQKQFNYRKDNFQKRIEVLKKETKVDGYYQWILGDMHFQEGLVRLRFGEYLSGAKSIRSSYNLLKDNRKEYPDFIYNNKYLGVLHVMIGAIPEEYKWLSALLGFNGTHKEGMKELSELASRVKETDPFIRETQMLHLFALMNFNNAESIRTEAEIAMARLKPYNPLDAFFVSSALMKYGRNDEVIHTLERVNPFAFPYLHYMRGSAHLNKLILDKATKEFDLFIANHSGESYKKSALHKSAWCQLLQGNHSVYKSLMKKVEETGSALTDEDKLARDEAKKGEVPDMHILKARLLTDGGYYDEAKKILIDAAPSVKGLEEEIEYCYRFARLYHRSGKHKKAESYYTLAIKKDKELKTYYPASSALQLALISEEQGDKNEAKRLFELCLSMNPPVYKASLHQKAKAGLRRLE